MAEKIDVVARPAGTAEKKGSAPVVVDFGKAKPKQIRELREGTGELTAKVLELIDELKADGTIGASAQPVVIVVEKKRKANPLSTLFR